MSEHKALHFFLTDKIEIWSKGPSSKLPCVFSDSETSNTTPSNSDNHHLKRNIEILEPKWYEHCKNEYKCLKKKKTEKMDLQKG